MEQNMKMYSFNKKGPLSMVLKMMVWYYYWYRQKNYEKQNTLPQSTETKNSALFVKFSKIGNNEFLLISGSGIGTKNADRLTQFTYF